MQRKSGQHRLLFPALAIALSLGLGCGSGNKPASSQQAAKPYHDVVLKIACPRGSGAALATRVVEQYGRAWAARTGARVDIVSYDADLGPRAIPEADVWVIATPDLAEFATADLIDPVPGRILQDESFAWSKVLPIYRHSLLV